MKALISTVLIMLLLSGCNRHKDPVTWTENADNGLRKEVLAGDITYTIQYKPAAYITTLEHVTEAQRQERQKQLEGMAWFNISLSVKGKNESPLRHNTKSLEEYTARQDYYLNSAPQDIHMCYGKDTLYVSSYWFENNQNLAAHETMIVGFKLPGTAIVPEQDMQLSFHDRAFNTGIIKTMIRKEDAVAASHL